MSNIMNPSSEHAAAKMTDCKKSIVIINYCEKWKLQTTDNNYNTVTLLLTIPEFSVLKEKLQ